MTITTNSRTIRRRNLDPTNSTHRAFEQMLSEAKSEKFSTLSPPEKKRYCRKRRENKIENIRIQDALPEFFRIQQDFLQH